MSIHYYASMLRCAYAMCKPPASCFKLFSMKQLPFGYWYRFCAQIQKLFFVLFLITLVGLSTIHGSNCYCSAAWELCLGPSRTALMALENPPSEQSHEPRGLAQTARCASLWVWDRQSCSCLRQCLIESCPHLQETCWSAPSQSDASSPHLSSWASILMMSFSCTRCDMNVPPCIILVCR
jgi:hypothetical protein